MNRSYNSFHNELTCLSFICKLVNEIELGLQSTAGGADNRGVGADVISDATRTCVIRRREARASRRRDWSLFEEHEGGSNLPGKGLF